MSAVNLDETDREIIELLRTNSRRTLGDIGKRVSLSPAAVKRRLDRLEADGVVLGYTVVTDDAKLGRAVEAFTELRIYGRTAVEELIKLAATVPEVDAVYVTAGDPDFIVRVRAANNERLLEIVNRFRRTDRIASTKTHIVLGGWDRMRSTASGENPGDGR
jgi:DNA-binding Lrp family transcriptional regulator